MRDKGMKVLVGGGHAVQWAQKLGLHGVLHTVSADGVMQVLKQVLRQNGEVSPEDFVKAP